MNVLKKKKFSIKVSAKVKFCFKQRFLQDLKCWCFQVQLLAADKNKLVRFGTIRFHNQRSIQQEICFAKQTNQDYPCRQLGESTTIRSLSEQALIKSQSWPWANSQAKTINYTTDFRNAAFQKLIIAFASSVAQGQSVVMTRSQRYETSFP